MAIWISFFGSSGNSWVKMLVLYRGAVPVDNTRRCCPQANMRNNKQKKLESTASRMMLMCNIVAEFMASPKANLTTRKFYGFRPCRSIEIVLYQYLG